ncbi:hypothetical protein [Brevibacillus formosus]|nr:hypothetical protein [Brevibacillus formosus]
MSDGRELTVGDYNGKGGWVRGIQIEIVGDQDAADIIELLRGAAGRIQDQYYQNNRRCDAYEQE